MNGLPPLEEAPAPLAPPVSGPPPLEGGPPPLEDESPAPAPPGLSAKPKPAVLLPPPLEEAGPPPLEPAPPPLAPPGTPAATNGGTPVTSSSNSAAGPFATAPAADTEAPSPEAICSALTDFLKRRPGNKELLNRVGVYLRSRKLSPEGQLKKFILQQCQGKIVVLESKSGTDTVQLAGAAAAERAAAEREREKERECAAAAAAAAEAASAAEASKPRPASAASAVDVNYDPSWLEERLMQHCVELRQKGVQPTMPLLGSFCIDELGLQMKGRLKPFLERRPLLCTLSDDPRQHVNLTPAGIILGGGSTASSAAAGTHPSSSSSSSHAQPSAAPLAGLAAGTLPGSSSSAAATHEQVAAVVLPGAPAAQAAVKDYKKWDPLTKEIFQFVRSKGVATYTQIDAHIKAHCPKHIAATNIPLGQWKSQFFLHKRRNIFRLQGPVVSLASYVPDAAEDSTSEAPAAPAEDFPPLPGSTGAAAAAPATASGSASTAGTTSSTPKAAGGAANAPAAATAADNPVLAAFAAERRQMEALRDDVEAKLASFKALSELQKENSGLRAACVTLGRELLALKSEFAAFQQQTAAALSHISPSAASLLMNGSGQMQQLVSPVTGTAAGAADAVAQHSAGAYGSAQPQQQQQQQPQADSAPRYLSADQAVAGPAHTQNGGSAAPPLPIHLPPSAPVVAAASPRSAPLPRGEIVLVGGHDGGSWLDSVDYFSPSEGVWASLPLLSQPRSFAAAVGTAAEVFVCGGGNGVEWFDSVLRYDRQAGLMGGWVELAPLQVARGSLAAGVASGYLFAYGGGKPKEQYNVVEWYDPQSNRWLPGPPLSRKRFALGGASLDGALYAVGGYDGAGYLDCAERLDPRTDRWEPLPGQMANKRGGHAVAAAGGLLYALGGFTKTQAVSHCEVFETRMNVWRAIADMADSRAYGSCAVLGSTVFAVGGLQSDMQTHAVLLERYDPSSDTWMHVELPGNANPRRSFLAAFGLE